MYVKLSSDGRNAMFLIAGYTVHRELYTPDVTTLRAMGSLQMGPEWGLYQHPTPFLSVALLSDYFPPEMLSTFKP